MCPIATSLDIRIWLKCKYKDRSIVFLLYSSVTARKQRIYLPHGGVGVAYRQARDIDDFLSHIISDFRSAHFCMCHRVPGAIQCYKQLDRPTRLLRLFEMPYSIFIRYDFYNWKLAFRKTLCADETHK